MGFIVYSPLGKKAPKIIKTTNRLVDQLWQEFVMLRYLKGAEKVNASKSISPWIDQAKTYFLDAFRSDWRSAGLLYYYSFLNLAKALLVAKRSFTYKSLNTVSIYHGLRADLQDVTSLPDYGFEIFPAQQNRRSNIFPYLYKTFTNQDWPFTNSITIRVADIAAYCEDISVEISRLFKIEAKIFSSQSLLRIKGNQAWFEMAVPASQVDVVKTHLPDWGLESIDSHQISQADKTDWLLALHRPANSFSQVSLIRGPKHVADNLNVALSNASKEATHYFESYAMPNFHENPQTAIWDFCPNINLNLMEIKWHPVLSNYLFAFVLSTILRYQPQLLKEGSPNCFVAEGWCSQSALTTLRYFLAIFTNPPLHIDTH